MQKCSKPRSVWVFLRSDGNVVTDNLAPIVLPGSTRESRVSVVKKQLDAKKAIKVRVKNWDDYVESDDGVTVLQEDDGAE